MWNPLEDLLSGTALSLFYYNLGYDLPLYLHINMDNDNDNCLAFWWFASTARHLGIGGGASNEKRYQAYKQAMSEYLPLKDLYSRGTFYGIDELTHIHVLPEVGRCVLNAYNLTDTPVSRDVDVRLNDLGLMEGCARVRRALRGCQGQTGPTPRHPALQPCAREDARVVGQSREWATDEHGWETESSANSRQLIADG
jgi:hypothetical protein